MELRQGPKLAETMRKLLDIEQNGHRVTRYFQDYDDAGKKIFVIHNTEDVEPVFKKAKFLKENSGKTFRFKASIPLNVINEVCKIKATEWGITKREAFAEIIINETGRSKNVWKVLTEGRDFRKLQGV